VRLVTLARLDRALTFVPMPAKLCLSQVITVLACAPFFLFAFSVGPDPRHTGAPGDLTCARSGCHVGTAVNSGGGKVELQLPNGLLYIPGQKQRITVQVTDSTANRFGYQASARLASNEVGGQAGTFTALGTDLILCADGSERPSTGCRPGAPLEFIEHGNSSNTSGRFVFEWTAPLTDVGPVRLYVAALAANGDGTGNGDKTYLANLTITPALPPLITTIAGTGVSGSLGDNGLATDAQLNTPPFVAVDASRRVYISDGGNRLRRIDTDGRIRTIAGTGIAGYSGDAGPATSAQLFGTGGVAVDAAGAIFFADVRNHRVRKIALDGTITTVAGSGPSGIDNGGFSGDGGPATAAQLFNPATVAVHPNGNLLIADTNNHRIRSVTPAGIISTVAGAGNTGLGGFSGDGGPATSAQLNNPTGIAVDSAGALIIADRENHRIRRVAPNGTIETIAGDGVAGFSGDGGSAVSARISFPQSVAADSAGNIFVAELGGSRIRKITPLGTIYTVAGTGVNGFNGDGISAFAAQLNDPFGVAVDNEGGLYIADTRNNRIRKVAVPSILPITFTSNPPGVPLTLGGREYTAPVTLNLESGSPISISAPSLRPLAAGSRLSFTQWSDGGARERIVFAGTTAATYTATYTTQHQLVRSVAPPSAGSLAEAPVTSDGFHNQGTTVQLQANPSNGFSFLNFTGDLVGTASPSPLLMSGPKSVTANFSCTYQPSVPTAERNGEAGTGTFTVSTGVSCPIAPVSEAPWLTVAAQGATITYQYTANNSGSTRIGTVRIGSATFTLTQQSNVPVTFATAPANLTYSVDGTTYSGSQVLFLAPGRSVSVAAASPQPGLAAVRYSFLNWSNNGTQAQTFQVPNVATSLLATFSTEFQLTTVSNPAAGGTMIGGGFHPSGTTVTVRATANAGFAFSGFSGDVVSPASPASIVMNAPKSVTASFVCTYQLSANAASVPATAGSGTVTLIAGAGCPVNPVSNASWLTVSSASGAGSSVITYAYEANPAGSSRTAAFLVGGQSFAVTQAPVGPTRVPSADLTGPFAAEGTSQTLTLRFSHPDGFDQLGILNVLINDALDGGNACYIAYSHPLGVLYLVNDRGPDDGLSPALVLGGTGTVANRQCSVSAAGSSATGSGNVLTLTLRLGFSASFSGNKVVYLAARDRNNGNSGWRTMGVSKIPGSAISFPRAQSGPQPISSSQTQAMSFVFQDATDASNLRTVWTLINSSVDARQACYVAYFVPGNLLFLFADNGDGTQAVSIPLTGTNVIENSQCRISAEGSSATRSGNQLTLLLNITMKPSFAGPKGIWAAAQTIATQTSPWAIIGAWTVPAVP
jgi:sugar lactone lactonase YvrE